MQVKTYDPQFEGVKLTTILLPHIKTIYEFFKEKNINGMWKDKLDKIGESVEWLKKEYSEKKTYSQTLDELLEQVNRINQEIVVPFKHKQFLNYNGEIKDRIYFLESCVTDLFEHLNKFEEQIEKENKPKNTKKRDGTTNHLYVMSDEELKSLRATLCDAMDAKISIVDRVKIADFIGEYLKGKAVNRQKINNILEKLVTISKSSVIQVNGYWASAAKLDYKKMIEIIFCINNILGYGHKSSRCETVLRNVFEKKLYKRVRKDDSELAIKLAVAISLSKNIDNTKEIIEKMSGIFLSVVNKSLFLDSYGIFSEKTYLIDFEKMLEFSAKLNSLNQTIAVTPVALGGKS